MVARRASSPLPVQFRLLAASVVDECLELLEDGQADVVTSIHECRKRIKRLRAQLRACRPTLSKRLFAAQDARFRDAGRHLSAWRERSARGEALARTVRHFGLPEPPRVTRSAGLEGYSLLDLEEKTSAERCAARTLLGQARHDVEGWLENLHGPEAVEALARGMFEEWRRAKRAYQLALEEPTFERVHAWRKHVKYHLHHLELGGGKHRGRKGRVRRLRELAEILGQAHDLADLRRTLASSGGALDGELNWEAVLSSREAELTLQAIADGSALFSERPGKVLRRVRRVLEAYR